METKDKTTPSSPLEGETRGTAGLKSLLSWIRRILGHHGKELLEAGEPPSEETVSKLIDKAVTGKLPPDSTRCGKDAAATDPECDGDAADTESCSFAIKRNIVRSLHAIREFAERHNLAETVLRAILILLAEMAVGAMKGKVGEKALETLLRALTFQQFADNADEIPHLGGLIHDTYDDDNIFNMAREA